MHHVRELTEQQVLLLQFSRNFGRKPPLTDCTRTRLDGVVSDVRGLLREFYTKGLGMVRRGNTQTAIVKEFVRRALDIASTGKQMDEDIRIRRWANTRTYSETPIGELQDNFNFAIERMLDEIATVAPESGHERFFALRNMLDDARHYKDSGLLLRILASMNEIPEADPAILKESLTTYANAQRSVRVPISL